MGNVNVKKEAKKAHAKAERITTKCSVCNKPFSYSANWQPARAEALTMCKECYEKKNNIVYRSVCKECGKPFYVRGGEAQWFKDKGLEMPKRCYECRSFNRIQKKKSAAEETK